MAPRKPVDDLPGLNSVSAPSTSVQGVIAFAPRDNALLDLAQSLKGVNRSLGEYADKVVEEHNKAAIEEGKRLAMLDDAKSYKEYVEKGGDPMASPWVVYGYKQQKGRVLGQSYQAFIADKKLNWEGSGSDDIDGQALVNTLPKWRQEFLQQNPDLDPVELTGFDAYAVPEEDNMVRQHIAEARQVATDNMKTQVYNEFYNLFGKPGMTEEQLYAKIDEVYNRQEFIGLRKEVGPMLLDAVADYASEHGDSDLIAAMRKYTRKDAKTGQAIPVLKNTRATAILDKAEKAALARSVTLDNLRRQREENDSKDKTKATIKDVVAEVVKTGKPVDPFKIANDAGLKGGDVGDVLSAVSSVNNILSNTRNQRSSQKMADLFFEIMTRQPGKPKEEYLKDINLAGGDKADLADFDRYWEEYVENGRTIFSEHPELEILVMDNYTQGITDKDALRRDVATAARSVLKRNVKPEAFAAEVKKVFEDLSEKRAKAFEAQFAPVPESNVDTNGVTQPKKNPASTSKQTSSLQLQPVMTQAELMAVRGKPKEAVDVLLQSKPIMSPALFAVAYRNIAAGKQSPESDALIRRMADLGIDTSDPVEAVKELIKRGQGKFYAATRSQQPQK